MKLIFSEFLPNISIQRKKYNSIHFMNQQGSEFFARSIRKLSKAKQNTIFDPTITLVSKINDQKVNEVLLVDILVEEFFQQRTVQKNIGDSLVQAIEKDGGLFEEVQVIKQKYIDLAKKLESVDFFEEYEISIDVERIDTKGMLQIIPINLLYESKEFKENIYIKKKAFIEFMTNIEEQELVLFLIYPETGMISSEKKAFLKWMGELGITIVALTNDIIFLQGYQNMDEINIFDKLNEKILLEEIVQEQKLFVSDLENLLLKNLLVILESDEAINPLESRFINDFLLEK